MKIINKIIPKNNFSNPEIENHGITAIVIHWPAMPNATPEKIQKYFVDLANQNPDDDKKDRYASTHYALGGEIVVRMINDNNVAYHVGSDVYTRKALDFFGTKYNNYGAFTPNYKSIGIEVCHTNWNGEMTGQTIDTLIKFCAVKCIEYSIDPFHGIFRHYDITEKKCPRWYTPPIGNVGNIHYQRDWNKLLIKIDEYKEKLMSQRKRLEEKQ